MKERAHRFYFAILAFSFAALTVFIHYQFVRTSTIANMPELRYELTGTQSTEPTSEWISEWMWTNEAPFKYRILGKLPVWGVYQLNTLMGIEPSSAFYYAYIACSYLSLVLVLFMLAVFVREFSNRIFADLTPRTNLALGAIAMALFMLSPPILFFVKYPVHGTPNDLVGYFLMLSALYFLLKGQAWKFCLVSIVAAFCRETTLLVPFIFLFFFRHYSLRQRIVFSLLPVGVFLIYRLAWPGTYDASVGARASFALPLQSLVFTWLIFGPLWISGIAGYFELRKQDFFKSGPFVTAFVSSFPWALLLSFSIILMLARVREIRIGYIMFLYMIPFSIAWFYQNRYRLLACLRNKFFVLSLFASLILTFRVSVWLMPASSDDYQKLVAIFGLLINGYLWTPQYNWIGIITACLFATLLLSSLVFISHLLKKEA